MNQITSGAVNLCTTMYLCVGIFGYIANIATDFSGNILTFYPSSFYIEFIKIGFGISVALSFPLVIFPCR